MNTETQIPVADTKTSLEAAFVCLRLAQSNCDVGMEERIAASHKAEDECLRALKAQACLERLTNSVRALLVDPIVRKAAANWNPEELIEVREAIAESLELTRTLPAS